MTYRNRLLDAVDELATCLDEASLIETAPRVLAQLLGADVAAATRIDAGRRTAELNLFPHVPRFVYATNRTAETMADNPVINHWCHERDFAPRRVSDLASRSEWRATSAFAHVLGPMGTPYLLGIPLFKPAAGGPSYAVARSGRDFTDDELIEARAVQAALLVLHRRLRLPAIPSADPCVVSPREREVLGLLALGLSGGQIARRLGVSLGTVRKHLERAYAKLGVHDRLTAVNAARERGVIPTNSGPGR